MADLNIAGTSTSEDAIGAEIIGEIITRIILSQEADNGSTMVYQHFDQSNPSGEPATIIINQKEINQKASIIESSAAGLLNGLTDKPLIFSFFFTINNKSDNYH